MCKIFEEVAAEAAAEAARDASEQTKIELAIDMIKDGKLSLSQIAKYSKLSDEKVFEIAASTTVQ